MLLNYNQNSSVPDCREIFVYSDKLVNSNNDTISYELNRADESVDTNILIKLGQDVKGYQI